MTDEELVRAFEAVELAPDAFPHEAHVRVAWWYVRELPLLDALVRFKTALQRFATAHGKPERYHETITVGYMLLVAERVAATPQLSWPEFAARHPDLFARNPNILSEYYTDALLESEPARRCFVFPNLGPRTSDAGPRTSDLSARARCRARRGRPAPPG